ncbi:MAG: SCO family protein [Chitinophagaceae bacterium]|nr:MAG: SCO family protein [Chitinophagaceae bacterium]
MSKKAVFYVVFFSILVVVFYFVMGKIIPGFTKSKLPPISTVQPFSFINQDGKLVSNNDVSGKVFVAEYFFTTCKGICPKMNGQMRRVYDKFKDENDFLILSHTCDPERDSVPTLKRFADSMKVNTLKWMFLTGRKDSLYGMARYSYKIDDPANNLKSLDEDFLHTQFWALVDKSGNVRKIYDGIKPSEVETMMTDIKKFLEEKQSTVNRKINKTDRLVKINCNWFTKKKQYESPCKRYSETKRYECYPKS